MDYIFEKEKYGSVKKASIALQIPERTFFHKVKQQKKSLNSYWNQPKKERKETIRKNALLLQQQRYHEEYKNSNLLKSIRTKKYKRVLVFGDMHIPYHHPDTFSFLKAIQDKLNPELIINLGDELDYHAMSFHDTDPDLDNAGAELLKGREYLHKLEQIMPNMMIVHSNHGSMKFRKAKTHGFPRHLILSYADAIFGERKEDGSIYRPNKRGNGWIWVDKLIFKTSLNQEVLCVHNQLQNCITNIQRNQMCFIQGHYHSNYEIRYLSSPYNLLWGVTTGCLVDDNSFAFNYNKIDSKRPIIGCVAVINGQPVLIPMLLEKGGRWCGKLVGALSS